MSKNGVGDRSTAAKKKQAQQQDIMPEVYHRLLGDSSAPGHRLAKPARRSSARCPNSLNRPSTARDENQAGWMTAMPSLAMAQGRALYGFDRRSRAGDDRKVVGIDTIRPRPHQTLIAAAGPDRLLPVQKLIPSLKE